MAQRQLHLERCHGRVVCVDSIRAIFEHCCMLAISNAGIPIDVREFLMVKNGGKISGWELHSMGVNTAVATVL